MLASQIMAVVVVVLGVGMGIAAMLPPLVDLLVAVQSYLKKIAQTGVVDSQKTKKS